jgi:4-hydroxy-tetrahydrodipicolinate reductase
MPPSKRTKVDSSSSNSTPPSVVVIMSGLPGAMGNEVSKTLLRRGIALAEFGLTGPNMPTTAQVENITVTLQDASNVEVAKTKLQQAREELEKKYNAVVVVDFTHPSAVNSNADIYNSLSLPFVMGTTGGDRDKLMQTTKEAKNHAVIAPNMCKQIVAFQCMMDHMASKYPGSFSGYSLSVTESHQKTKADTSGTAKAVVKSLSALTGTPFPEESIVKVRGDEESKAFGVPQEFLTGHAHHTYHLESGDKSVVFEFKHNVNGRSTYTEGVADAVLFLAKKIVGKAKPKIFNMIDILEEGGMT